MSRDINRAEFSGRLTRDPEVRKIPSGSTVTNFSIAVNRSYKDKEDNWQEKVTFVECVGWNGVGESIAKYLRKGSSVYVVTEMTVDSWEKDGVKRTANKFTVMDWRELAVRKGEKKESKAEANKSNTNVDDEEDSDTEIPF